MKNFLLILLSVLSVDAFGQNLFYIGNKSYPSTETFSFQLNSEHPPGEELNCIIAKKNTSGILAISIGTMTGVIIRGKVIMYLDDGSMISLIDRGIYDYVDGIATTVFYLTTQEIQKLKTANINKVRYSLKCKNCLSSTEEGNYSASNTGSGYGFSEREKVDVPSLVANLFDE